MPDTFPVIENPDWGLADQTQDDIYQVSFGDGYQLRQPAGINHQRRIYDLNWGALTPAVAKSTYEWLKPKKGVEAFLWAHPDGYTVKVLCTNIKLVQSEYDNSTLAATFVEDFNP